MNNCIVKGALSGVMGFGMGGLFGLFMASVRRHAYHTGSSYPELQFCSNFSGVEHRWPMTHHTTRLAPSKHQYHPSPGGNRYRSASKTWDRGPGQRHAISARSAPCSQASSAASRASAGGTIWSTGPFRGALPAGYWRGTRVPMRRRVVVQRLQRLGLRSTLG